MVGIDWPLGDDTKGRPVVVGLGQPDMFPDDALYSLPFVVRQLGEPHGEHMPFDPGYGCIRETQGGLPVVQIQCDRDVASDHRKRRTEDFTAGF
jgi:hypothetical protein